MKIVSRLASFALLLAHAWAWKHATRGNVRTGLESNGYTLIAFVMPSENASKALEKEWTPLQRTTEGRYVLSFDCGKNLKACKEYDVASFPAIRLYHRDGRMDRYRGPRRGDAIAAFLRRCLRPSVLEVTQQSLTSFITVDDLVFVGHLDPDDYLLYRRYTALAKKLRDQFSFGLADADSGQSVLRCYNNVDDVQHEATDLARIDALERFVRRCATPLIPELTRRSEREMSLKGKDTVYYVATTEQQKDRFRSRMRPLAKKYKEGLQFCIVDVDKYPESRARLGLAPEARTGLVLKRFGQEEPILYRGGEAVTANVVEAFLGEIGDARGPGSEHGEAAQPRRDEL